MKKLKTVAALMLALVMLLSTTACSGDTTWSAKYEDTTLPVGVYIYNTYSAYYQAYYQVTDSSTPVMDQKIGDKPVSDWIKEKATESIKSTLYTQKKFKELGLSFTEEELSVQQKNLDSSWAQGKAILEKLGIAKESLNIASIQQQAMYIKIFEAIYGKGGEKAVSDSELEDYYVDNYTHYGYFTKALTTTDKNKKTVNLSDEEIKKIGEKFEEYAKDINENGKKPEDVAKTYKDDEDLESDPYRQNTLIVKDSTLSDDLQSALKDLDAGKAKAVKSGTTYYLLYKYDIKDSVSDLKKEETRTQYLSYMKGEEFDTMMAEGAEALEGVTINDSALKKYTPERVANLTKS
ncbi:MAG: hypothetical protein HFE39_04300 [Clostridiales bacterium]|nr:hypothetical protein [Clostridiales bacterium]